MGRDPTENDRRFTLNTGVLKWIAMIAMICDHFAKIILQTGMEQAVNTDSFSRFLSVKEMQILSEALGDFGRVAFVLYAFLVVEGFFLTRNSLKYFGRLALFAFLSEIPFDLAFNRMHLNPASGILMEGGYQNTLFTLALGLLTILFMDGILTSAQRKREAAGRKGTSFLLPVILCAAVTAGCMTAAWRLQSDYRMYGVVAIAAGYGVRALFRRMPGYSDKTVRMICAAVIVIPLLLLDETELWGFAALIPLWFCCGGEDGTEKRTGRGGTRRKWFFYWFYPLHLLALVFLRTCLFG